MASLICSICLDPILKGGQIASYSECLGTAHDVCRRELEIPFCFCEGQKHVFLDRQPVMKCHSCDADIIKHKNVFVARYTNPYSHVIVCKICQAGWKGTCSLHEFKENISVIVHERRHKFEKIRIITEDALSQLERYATIPAHIEEITKFKKEIDVNISDLDCLVPPPPWMSPSEIVRHVNHMIKITFSLSRMSRSLCLLAWVHDIPLAQTAWPHDIIFASTGFEVFDHFHTIGDKATVIAYINKCYNTGPKFHRGRLFPAELGLYIRRSKIDYAIAHIEKLMAGMTVVKRCRSYWMPRDGYVLSGPDMKELFLDTRYNELANFTDYSLVKLLHKHR